jgi:hypothetical protein
MINQENLVKPTSQELILKEVEKLLNATKNSYQEIKRFTLEQVWKILQILIATTIQIIEIIGNDLSGPEKKQIAMNIISDFYDNIFVVVDVPFIPQILESYLHKYIKTFIMILVGSTIDSMVKVFKDVGVFKQKLQYQGMFPI